MIVNFAPGIVQDPLLQVRFRLNSSFDLWPEIILKGFV